jgi:hypothetical protein
MDRAGEWEQPESAAGSFAREAEGKCTAGACGALDFDVATEQARERSADAQAESGTRMRRAASGVELRERLEDALQIVRRYADAAVRDAERDVVALRHHIDVDRVVGGELHRVAEQVEGDLSDLAGVGMEPDRFGRGVEADDEPA